jgi:hypothetical protein
MPIGAGKALGQLVIDVCTAEGVYHSNKPKPGSPGAPDLHNNKPKPSSLAPLAVPDEFRRPTRAKNPPPRAVVPHEFRRHEQNGCSKGRFYLR